MDLMAARVLFLGVLFRADLVGGISRLIDWVEEETGCEGIGGTQLAGPLRLAALYASGYSRGRTKHGSHTSRAWIRMEWTWAQ